MDENTKALEEMVAVIAHEIKNPLSLLKANISLLEKGCHLDRYKDNFCIMHKELDKINELLFELLDFVNINNDEHDLVYINDIIQELLTHNKIANEKNIRFIYSCPNEDLCVAGSSADLTKLFSNLIKNAVEAVDTNGIIEITAWQTESGVTVIIKDNGCGFGEAHDKIFQTFYTTKPKGSGLGLYICKKIIKKHGGSLSLFNNSEGGATAKIVFSSSVN